MCVSCGQSYDKYLRVDSTTLGLLKWAARRERTVGPLAAALRIALASMQANIAMATVKDEPALVRGILAARAALRGRGDGW